MFEKVLHLALVHVVEELGESVGLDGVAQLRYDATASIHAKLGIESSFLCREASVITGQII